MIDSNHYYFTSMVPSFFDGKWSSSDGKDYNLRFGRFDLLVSDNSQGYVVEDVEPLSGFFTPHSCNKATLEVLGEEPLEIMKVS